MESTSPSCRPLCGTCFGTFRGALEPYGHFSSRLGELSNTPFQWNLGIHTLNNLAVLKVRCSDGWSFTHERDDEGLCLLVPHVGHLEVTLGKRKISVPPGQALSSPKKLLHNVKLSHSDGNGLILIDFFNKAVAREIIGRLYDTLLHEFDHDPRIDLSQGIGLTLDLMIQSLVAGMRASQSLGDSPNAMTLLGASMVQLIAQKLQSRPVDSTGCRLFDAPPRHLYTMPRHVKAAVDFMNANLHRSLTVSEIASFVGVSVRSLQTGFQCHYHTTPLRYLRQIRLNAVHAELSSSENRLSIGEVAMKWGFTHLGRFSAEYRATYGHLPSETVRKREEGG